MHNKKQIKEHTEVIAYLLHYRSFSVWCKGILLFLCRMIGVFDSGLGGVQSLLYFKHHLPEQDFLFLGDSAYVPYGEKSGQWIHDRTFVCLEWLFAQGCEVVILACNTASAYAIRDRQQRFPDRKVLSVTVPGVEALVAGGYTHPLLLATKVTIETHIYESVRERLFSEYPVVWHIAVGTGRVDAIESGRSGAQIRELVVRGQLDRFTGKIDSIILGCTHYPLMHDIFRDIFPDLPIIDPARASAVQLPAYLARHGFGGSSMGGTCLYAVTGDADYFATKIHRLRGMHVVVDHIDLA